MSIVTTQPLPPYLTSLGDGIHAIDTGFQRDRFDAAYLIVDAGRAAFIDTGTNHALPRLLGALEALGIARDAVEMVIPTHVHLDHAGGAGALMRELPAATMWVHPRGARHMVDPRALWQGALAVYGADEMARSYGALVAVDANRVRTTEDGMRLSLGDRQLLVADTPGHARHHHCLWDATSRGWFSGDTFGLSYREFDVPGRGAWILPTTTPVQFDPQALDASIARMLDEQPDWMYLTHFGRVGDVQRLGRMLREQIAAMADLGERLRDAPSRHEALMAGLLDIHHASLQAFGSPLSRDEAAALLGFDLELNAQGIASWLDRPPPA